MSMCVWYVCVVCVVCVSVCVVSVVYVCVVCVYVCYNTDLWVSSRPTDSYSLSVCVEVEGRGGKPRNLHFNKASRLFLCVLRYENLSGGRPYLSHFTHEETEAPKVLGTQPSSIC